MNTIFQHSIPPKAILSPQTPTPKIYKVYFFIIFCFLDLVTILFMLLQTWESIDMYVRSLINYVLYTVQSAILATATPCVSRSPITVAVVTCARLRVVISLFQPQEQSITVLAASLLQDRPCGTLF